MEQCVGCEAAPLSAKVIAWYFLPMPPLSGTREKEGGSLQTAHPLLIRDVLYGKGMVSQSHTCRHNYTHTILKAKHVVILQIGNPRLG